MIDVGIVQGSAEQAVPLVVGVDTVYVHTDITQITEDNNNMPVSNLYSYHEVQYDKDEYIKIQAEKNAALEQQVTDTQMALCEVYELIA